MPSTSGESREADTDVFGPYRLVELLGRGGMGEVYRAYDNEHSRTVALKRLVGHLADEPEFEKRFRREAFNVARLRSPHVIPIHRYGEIDGQLYIDMRYVDGGDLADLVAAGPLAPDRAVTIVEQLAGALDEAHAHRLVHRDVKPSSLVTRRLRPDSVGVAQEREQRSSALARAARVGVGRRCRGDGFGSGALAGPSNSAASTARVAARSPRFGGLTTAAMAWLSVQRPVFVSRTSSSAGMLRPSDCCSAVAMQRDLAQDPAADGPRRALRDSPPPVHPRPR